MGADASAYLILGIDFGDVYELKNDETEYDIHDLKTGLKTGKKGYETTTYYQNIHTKEKYDTEEIYDLGISNDYIHSMEQESKDYMVGVIVGSVTDSNGSYKNITTEMLDKAHKKFEELIRPHLKNFKIEPRLILHLYWSY